jgi:hypothetical protein
MVIVRRPGGARDGQTLSPDGRFMAMAILINGQTIPMPVLGATELIAPYCSIETK